MNVMFGNKISPFQGSFDEFVSPQHRIKSYVVDIHPLQGLLHTICLDH